MTLSRRRLLASSSIALAGAPLLRAAEGNAAGVAGAAPTTGAAALSPVHDQFPTTRPELAREMVGVSHGNIARVRELLALHPALARASWDWGYGDWESALGARAWAT